MTTPWASDLDVDIAELVLSDGARVVAIGIDPVVLFERHRVGADGGDPGDVSIRAGAIRVGVEPGDAARHGASIDRHARLARRAGPQVGVAPEGAFVLVRELDAEAVINAPGDEARAFCDSREERC